nr:hypothetical protein [uncultured Methanobacterium sp.]
MTKNMHKRIYTATVREKPVKNSKLLTLEGEHDFGEDETVIIMGENDFNQMQKMMEHQRKMISSFEVMLEEIKNDENATIGHQKEIITELNNECSIFMNELSDTQGRLEELYGLYDSLNGKYDEMMTRNFNLDEQFKNKVEEAKQILQNVYSIKNRHPLTYIKERMPQSYIPLKSSSENKKLSQGYRRNKDKYKLNNDKKIISP